MLVATVLVWLPAVGTMAAVGAALGAATSSAQPTYSFRTLNDNADTTFNQLLGINDAGVIAGYFGSGTPPTTHPNKGYTLAPPYTQGNYTDEDFPGSQQSQVTGIDDLGDTVGFWVDPAGESFGFSDVRGEFTSVANPVAGCGADFDQLLGLNDGGIAAGFCNDAEGKSHPYTLDLSTGVFTDITLPSSFSAASAFAAGVNDSGDVAGTYTSGSTGVTAGFLDVGGTFSSILFPGSKSTMVLGINNSDELVGSYVDTGGRTHGFTDTRGAFQTIDDPHASEADGGTTVNGLNNNGQLVGYYGDSNGHTNGFLADSNHPAVAANPYHPVSPFRLCDTRSGSGTSCAGQTLGPGGTLDVQVSGEDDQIGGVPADATAVVLNVTEADATASSFFTVYPAGQPLPTASSLNFGPNEVVPNLVEVGLGTGGDVSIFNANGSADAVVDLEGYVAPPGSGTGTSGRFNPLTPSRICDTRTTGGSGPNQCNAQGVRPGTVGPGGTLTVSVEGQGGIPASGVSAVALNVTVTNPTSPSFLTVYPNGESQPTASNLNFSANQTVPNRVIVPVGSNGTINVFNAAGSADVIVDVNGWFTDSTTSSGDLFTPAASPIRILDTRIAGQSLGPQGLLGMVVAGSYGLPTDSAAVVANVTVTDTTAASFLTLFPNFASLPLTSDLNWSPGTTIANLTITQLGFGGGLEIFNQAGSVNVVLDVAGWYTPASPS